MNSGVLNVLAGSVGSTCPASVDVKKITTMKLVSITRKIKQEGRESKKCRMTVNLLGTEKDQ